MPIPKPGHHVRGSRSGAPVNAVFDLLGRRWSLGIIWYLGDGAASFRVLQDRCGNISPSILNSRLKDLREADVVERSEDGYRLTERGRKLRDTLVPLAQWSLDWAEDLFGYPVERTLR
jgi:DNA-binding HxlR family transcriptional regulator